jgi:hypothetical protein
MRCSSVLLNLACFTWSGDWWDKLVFIVHRSPGPYLEGSQTLASDHVADQQMNRTRNGRNCRNFRFALNVQDGKAIDTQSQRFEYFE